MYNNNFNTWVNSKLFHSFDKIIVNQCQFYSGQTPVEFKIANRKLNFLKRLCTTDNIYCQYFDVGQSERINLINRYFCMTDNTDVNFASYDNNNLNDINFKFLLKKYFEKSIELYI